MTDKEKEILKRLSLVLPNVSEAKKEYLLGVADGIAFEIIRVKKEITKEQSELLQTAD